MDFLNKRAAAKVVAGFVALAVAAGGGAALGQSANPPSINLSDGDFTVDVDENDDGSKIIVLTPITSAPPVTDAPTTTLVPSTTLVPETTQATTTTQAPTTTVAPTTQAPTTTAAPTTSTTGAPTTTVALPSGFQFVERFTTNQAARFDWQMHVSANGGPCDGSDRCTNVLATDHAEHDMACGNPATHRHVPAMDPATLNDFMVLDPAATPNIYYCAPGDDAAKGHMMTAIDTTGVVVMSFSPKQTFNDVSRICFDINTNNNVGGGKWVNAWVIPLNSLADNDGRFDFADTNFDADQEVPGPEDFRFKYQDGSIVVGPTAVSPTETYWWEWYRRATEPATRFQQCLEQTGPGQFLATREFPFDVDNDGTIEPGEKKAETRSMPGDFPDGPVRVIFQDGNYNPSKHGDVTGGVTWHWDNIEIS